MDQSRDRRRTTCRAEMCPAMPRVANPRFVFLQNSSFGMARCDNKAPHAVAIGLLPPLSRWIVSRLGERVEDRFGARFVAGTVPTEDGPLLLNRPSATGTRKHDTELFVDRRVQRPHATSRLGSEQPNIATIRRKIDHLQHRPRNRSVQLLCNVGRRNRRHLWSSQELCHKSQRCAPTTATVKARPQAIQRR